jgi:hypothetical protein
MLVTETPIWVVHDQANLLLTEAVMTFPSLAWIPALASTVNVCDFCELNVALIAASVSLVTVRESLTSNVGDDQT